MAVIMTAVIAVQAILILPAQAAYVTDRQYQSRFALVIQQLKNDKTTMDAVEKLGKTAVFISVSNGKQKARVFSYSGSNLDSVLEKTYEKAKKSGIFPKWFKLDVMTGVDKTTYSEFVSSHSGTLEGSFRRGIAFNSYYGTAMLEAQINSCGILNYDTGKLSLTRINAELDQMGKKQLTGIPSDLYVIKTQGYFAENNSFAIKLTNGSYADTGRREFELSRTGLELLARKSSSYLRSICDTNGKYIYGYYPIDNKEIEGYNILRHAGTVWDMIMLYDMCGDSTLIPVIESNLMYLKKFVQYKDNSTAFIVDGSYLNIGGNGLALLAYSAYAEVFGSSKYNSLVTALANGVIYFQKKDGSFSHCLNKSDYSVFKDYVVIYYDGEAAFGLLKAYGITGKSKFLSAAKKAADYFVDNNYEKENSHWISYTFNELTKYAPEEKYFEFGLKNITENNYTNKLYKTRSGRNSAGETINAAFELYDRLISGGYKCAYLDEFDAEKLVNTVVKRMDYELNFFMFPEYAMYFKAPQTVLNSFAVREDKFRIRIDDIQHFMDGYYLYWKNLDRVQYYLDKFSSKEAE